MAVPLLDLKPQFQSMKAEIMAEIEAICDSQMFINGPKVEKLEQEIAAYCGTKFACGVTSGSDALIISLMVSGIKAGDEVITTPFTFFATAGAIARVGATPVFVDIEPDYFSIDASKIERELGWRPRFTFERGIEQTVDWYLQNDAWMAGVLDGSYRQYYEKMYGGK